MSLISAVSISLDSTFKLLLDVNIILKKTPPEQQLHKKTMKIWNCSMFNYSWASFLL
jgi:hypothetical protein